MPLLITPWDLKRRADLYHQLASFTSAGVGLLQGLEFAHESRLSKPFRKPLEAIIDSLHRGSTFSESVGGLGRWLPEFDVALIDASEKSGRLDTCFRLLSEYYQETASLVQKVISDLMYPVFVFHFAVLIFPPTMLSKLIFEGDVVTFIMAKGAILAPIYLGVFFLVFLCQGRHGETWRGILEKIFRFIPVLGSARQDLALGRLSAALEGLLNAGVSVIEAWELAANASGSPAIRRTVASWRPFLQNGRTPADMVDESDEFPELFASLYRTGEFSGSVDNTLRRLYNHYREEGTRKLGEFARWTPRLVYIGILLAIGYQIVSFYSGYFSEVSKVMQ